MIKAIPPPGIGKIEFIMSFWRENDRVFLEKMIAMGYEREAIVQSVTNRAYDEIYATYMLLGTKEPEEWVWKP